MQVTLVVQKGPARTRAIRLTAGETIVGRSRDCDLCIPSSDISRRHCLIALANGQVTVEDLSSANGTFVNGVRITGVRKLRGDDELRIGPLTFTLKFEGTQLNMPPVQAGTQGAAPEGARGSMTPAPLLDVIPFVDTGTHPGMPTPPPPTKSAPAKTEPAKSPPAKSPPAEPAKPAPTKPEPVTIQPAASADDDDDAVNLDDISWDLPAGKSFRDILDDMKE
jgi:predicted component of type VI protein secretion system